MNSTKNYFIIIFILVLLAFSTGCAQKQNIGQTNEEDSIVIGFSLGTFKEERWEKDRDFFIERANQLGASVNLLAANADPDLQKSQAENLILQGVDVLVIVPEDTDAATEIVEKAHKAGIKVISYDRLIRNTDVDFYVSFQNDKVGEFQAKGVLDIVGKGNIAYIGGSPSDNNAFLLKEGSMRLLSPKIESGDIKLVYDNFTDEWKPAIAYQNMKSALEQNEGKIDGVIAANDGTAFGAIQALSEYGLAGKIPVSGQDAELAALQRILEGTQTMTVYKPLKQLAYKSAEVAVAIAKKEEAETNGFVNNGKIEVPSFLIEPTFVNKDNIVEVVKDGFHDYEEVYKNVPQEQRPQI